MTKATKEAVIIPFPEAHARPMRPEAIGREALGRVTAINSPGRDPFLELGKVLPEIFKADVMRTLSRIANDNNYTTASEAAALVTGFIKKTKRKDGRIPNLSEIEAFIGYE